MAPKARHPSGQQPVLAPPVDILREGDALVLIFAIPGVRADDFRISLVGNRQVYIEGTIPHRYPVPREHMSQVEIPTGPFARTVDLPFPVDGGGALVSFQNGLLTVRLPVRLERLPLQWQPSTGGGHHAQPN
jgi:HSP20 family protein